MMSYGTIKVDTIVFTDNGTDKTVEISGLVQNPTFSGNIVSTGTISGTVIRGGTTVSGATVTGGIGQFTTLTGSTAGFTTITGTTVTGTTANFVTVSGTTVTGGVGRFTTLSGGTVNTISGVFAAGTVTNPSITFSGDPNTGIYRPASDQLALTTNGEARLTVNSDGQIEAGALGSAALPAYTFASDPNTGIYSPGADQAAISTAGSERIRLGSSGEIGLGGANYGTNGQILTSGGPGSSPSWTTISTTTDKIEEGNTSAEVIDTGSDGRFVVITEGTEALRVDPSRRLLMGMSAATNAVHGVYSVALPMSAGSLYCTDSGTDRTGINISQWANNAQDNCGFLIFYRARSNAVGSYALASNNDPVGSIEWNIGGTSSTLGTIASFQACVDGTPSSTSTPGRLVFFTNPGSTRLTTERLRITPDGAFAYNQSAPTAINTSATATIANLKARLITSSTASPVTITLPTGANCDGGFNGLYNNLTFEWVAINTGSTNAITIAGNTGHTIVGSDTISANTSGRFATRRTTSNTWVSYRV